MAARSVAAFLLSAATIIGIYYLGFAGTEFWQLAGGFDVLIPAALSVALANVIAVILPTSLLVPITQRLRVLWLAFVGGAGGFFAASLYLLVIVEAPLHFDFLAVIGCLGGVVAGVVWGLVEAKVWPTDAMSIHD